MEQNSVFQKFVQMSEFSISNYSCAVSHIF